MKRFLIVAGIAVGVVILLILMIPLFFNADSFRPQIETKLSSALGRPVTIGKIGLAILSGGAEADTIAIADDPAFDKGPFLKASSLQIGLEWIPLIFSRQIRVSSITIKKPEILLLKNAAGKWNYSSLGNSSKKAEVKAAAPASADPGDVSVGKFEIQDGKIQLGQVKDGSIGKEQTFDKVSLLAKNISMTSVIPFTLSALTPGGGALKLDGKAGPFDQQDAAGTPLDAKFALEHADLGAAGFFDPESGLGGVLDFDGTIQSDGRHLRSEGKAKANNLRVVKGSSPARQAINLDYKSDYALDSQTANLNASVHTGNSVATTSGTLASKGAAMIANLKVAGQNMAVNDLEGLLPAFGVVMPSGASLQGGTLTTQLNAEGPLDHLVITGPVDISGTHLTGYNLSSKMGAIAAFTGIHASSDTLIQTLSSALRVAPEGIHADNVLLDVPEIGQVTGNGVISGNNALDFKMLLKLANGAGGLLGTLSTLSGGAQGKGIPFLIQGTTSNPKFVPAMGGLSGGNPLKALQGAAAPGQTPSQGLGGILGNILDKKKKP